MDFMVPLLIVIAIAVAIALYGYVASKAKR
jgi:hypothetical protein